MGICLTTTIPEKLMTWRRALTKGRVFFIYIAVFFGSSFAFASASGSSSRYNGSAYGNTYSSSNSSSFRAPPSNFTWSVPPPTTMPRRGIPQSLLPTMTGSLPLSSTAPNCSGLNFANIYSGLCSTTNTNIPYVGVLAGYEGVRCQAGSYNFTVNYTDGSGTVVQKAIAANLSDADQWPTYVSGQTIIPCISLKELPSGTAFSIAGKVLKGTTTFQCIAGEWRLTEMSCNDAPAVCPAQNFTAAWNGYTINAPLVSATQGQVQTVSCAAALGAPPTGNYWAGAGFDFLCSASGSPTLNSSACTATPTVNLVYPNCAGGSMVNGVYTFGLGGGVENVCLDSGGVCQWDNYGPFAGSSYINPLTGGLNSSTSAANVGCSGYNAYVTNGNNGSSSN